MLFILICSLSYDCSRCTKILLSICGCCSLLWELMNYCLRSFCFRFLSVLHAPPLAGIRSFTSFCSINDVVYLCHVYFGDQSEPHFDTHALTMHKIRTTIALPVHLGPAKHWKAIPHILSK